MKKRDVAGDPFFQRAKRERYAARSAYKLIEIDDRKRLLRKGDAVLDLGCAPGAWLQVAAERVGEKGAVVGVDLQRVAIQLPAHARAVQGDVYEIEPGTLTPPGKARFDALLSDMAPSTTGAGDHFLSVRLCDRVLELAHCLLRPGGVLAMKVFEGEAYADLVARTRALFGECKGFKPKACRGESREIYIVAKGFHPPED